MSFLIVGLGNIGAEYANTRHNIGFNVLDSLAGESNISFESSRLGSVAEYKHKGKKFFLLKPSTYMNLSGKAVNYWLKEKKIPIENLLVIVDDLALPLGTLRMRKQGSDGGHNGLKDIAETLGHNNYSRLRIGIGDNFGHGGQIDFVPEIFDEIVHFAPVLFCRAAGSPFTNQMHSFSWNIEFIQFALRCYVNCILLNKLCRLAVLHRGNYAELKNHIYLSNTYCISLLNLS